MVFSLATGAAVALCIDVLNTHDIKLARQLYQFVNHGDILLGDRAFCAYADIVAIKKLMYYLPYSSITPITARYSPSRHHLNNFIPELLVATSTKRLQIYRTLLKIIAHKTVPERPSRSEPRVRKRRPKIYPLMTKPRHELCKQLQTA
ncbi:hypothetical protein CDG77_25765 [Nostoc sp. 'Peltigera membranacea cyanobiont' 213]|uniref:hypothetical protein n=1 Tax=Nostoc sp. 'Peltigera membranacea cyanobiont' 213 TaxID=2014530 RepID=UPI000B95BC8F|nr:hypothetical protein [Nostoc sp. 'Peltigera membranacea cyanobiont' 213]OYD88074.1 hypothetical protein CDG77_25765 [Nostoc sp. 'Peltigera membranacea cyanobiont' 213]